MDNLQNQSGQTTSSSASQMNTIAPSAPSVRSRIQGVSNDHYNIISTIYHALQGCETSMKYEEDARNAGREELALFFQDVQKQELKRVSDAKKFLKGWIASEEADGIKTNSPSQADQMN